MAENICNTLFYDPLIKVTTKVLNLEDTLNIQSCILSKLPLDAYPEEVQNSFHKFCSVIPLEDHQKLILEGDYRYKSLNEIPHLSSIILFGFSADSFGLNIRINPFQVIPFQQRKILFCPSIKNFEDIKFKTQLWKSTQQLFQF